MGEKRSAEPSFFSVRKPDSDRHRLGELDWWWAWGGVFLQQRGLQIFNF
jgi:hypothetical protein